MNRQQIEHFYDVFRPSQISIQKEESFNDVKISDREQYVKVCLDNPDASLYSSYNRLDGTRNADNIVQVNYIFVDADDEISYRSLLQQLDALHIKIAFISKSGPYGHQLFIPIPSIDINKDNRHEISTIFSNFIEFIASRGLCDIKCKDLARLCRIWGTINNKKKYDDKIMCELIQENPIDDDDRYNNFNIIKGISIETSKDYTMFSDYSGDRCLFLDALFDKKIDLEEKENNHFNDVFGKNMCIYAWKKFGKNIGLSRCRTIYGARKSHVSSKADAWFRRIENDEKFRSVGCEEMKKILNDKYPKIFHKECKRCIADNYNNIIYCDDYTKKYKDFAEELKYVQYKPKFFINNDMSFNGMVSPSEFSEPEVLILAKVFRYSADNKKKTKDIITIEDIEDFDEPQFVLYYKEAILSKTNIEALIPDGYRYSYSIKAPMYIYRFKSDGNKYTLLSEKELPLGKLIINGMLVANDDRLRLFNTATLPINQNVIFVHSVQDVIKKYKDISELPECSSDDFMKCLYATNDLRAKGGCYTFEQPGWLTSILLSFLFSSKLDDYPIHISFSGPPRFGKTTMLKAISRVSGDERVEVGSSTMKGLIPSFKGTCPQIGVLARASRFAILDELMRLLSKSADSEDQFADANNILEHRKATAVSGNGDVKVKMNAKIIAASNPAYPKLFLETIASINEAFRSRLLHINIPYTYMQWLTDSNRHKIEDFTPTLSDDDMIAIVDFFNNMIIDIDHRWIDDIRSIVTSFMIPEELKSYCGTGERFINHHLPLMLEGIAKTRLLNDRNNPKEIIEADLIELKHLITVIIDGWRCQHTASITHLSDTQKYIIQVCSPEIALQALKDMCKERHIAWGEVKFLQEKNILEIKNNKVSYIQENLEDELTWDEIK